MSNELVMSEEEKAMIAAAEETCTDNSKKKLTFIPPIKVTYQSSAAFGEGKAKVGDFFYNDCSLGNSIDVVYISHCYYSEAIIAQSWGDSIAFPKENLRWTQTQELLDFKNKHANADKINTGLKILFYIPNLNSIGELFFKGMLAGKSHQMTGGISALIAGRSGKMINMTTRTEPGNNVDAAKVKSKNKWCEIDVKYMGDSPIPLASDKHEELLNTNETLFLKYGNDDGKDATKGQAL